MWYMSTRIERLHMECIHLLLCLYILYRGTAVSGGLSASWLTVGWWGQLCIAITHMQPTACDCFAVGCMWVLCSTVSQKTETKSMWNQDKHESRQQKQWVCFCRTHHQHLQSVMLYFRYCRFQGVTTVIALDYMTCTLRPKCSSTGLGLGYVQCLCSKGAGLTCFQGWASWSREIQKFCIWDCESESTSHILLVHGTLIWHPPVRVF